MDTESDSSSEDDIKVLALMHQLDPSVPPFKLARHDDIMQLPPLDLPRFFLQEINKSDEDAMDEDARGKQPGPDPEDPGPPELLRSISKQPRPDKPAPSITASLKKFAKVPRHMDGGSSAYNATPLVRTKSVCFERPGSSAPDIDAGLVRMNSVCFEPTWGGGSLPPGPPDTPTKPPTPPTPGLPDAPDVNAVAFITEPAHINIAAGILPARARPPPNPDSMLGTIRNLFAAAAPDLGLAEFDNFGD